MTRDAVDTDVTITRAAVCDAIKDDLGRQLLEMTVPVEDENSTQGAIDHADQNQDGAAAGGDQGHGDDDAKPKAPPFWYSNTFTRMLWENASQSQ
jgi:hypothetical protein